MNIKTSTFKRGLLFFWAIFYFCVCITNAFDLGKALHILPSTWTYTSGNFILMTNVVKSQGLPLGFAIFLFVGVILWEGLAGVYFSLATAAYPKGQRARVNTAFAMGIALWATFIIGIELLISFEKVSTGMFFQLLVASIISWLLIYLLPD